MGPQRAEWPLRATSSGQPPVPAEYVLVDQHNKPHFLCALCARILEELGKLDTFIQELAEWEEEQLTSEERKARDWADWGDRKYHRMLDEGEI
jgi:hypothetical protein